MNKKKKAICKRCGKEVEELDLFSGGICLECYEKEYEKLSEKDKKPVFDKSLLN